MDKQISFVIPVYHVEAYLDQCLGSILEQCGDSCEVVMVDDGSKDGSPAICDRYCAQYPNARVVHIPNGGNSAARNLGVELAQGAYICFVDSDDYIAPGHCVGTSGRSLVSSPGECLSPPRAQASHWFAPTTCVWTWRFYHC